jgi:hypothetical protein
MPLKARISSKASTSAWYSAALAVEIFLYLFNFFFFLAISPGAGHLTVTAIFSGYVEVRLE